MINPFAGLMDLILAPLAAVAGWAWDTVTSGITNWLAKMFVLTLSFMWTAMDLSSSPHPDAEWFSGTGTSPYVTAAGIAAVILVMMVLVTVIQGVLAGEPGALIRRFALETPAAVAGIVFTVSFTVIFLKVTDEFTGRIWSATRVNAVPAVENMMKVAAAASPGTALPAVLFVVGALALLALWVVLLLRESLVYLVVALCPLAWALGVWPTLKPVRTKVLELLGGLIFSKVAIGLALAVGLGAMGGIGATGKPGGGVVANGFAEISTLLAGVITFALAAFMPYLVVKLLPVVEAAAIAQGVAHAPMRAGQQAMQYSYSGQQSLKRMASGGPSAAGHATGRGDRPGGAAPTGAGGGPSTPAGTARLAGQSIGGRSGGAAGGGGGAGAVAGPAAAVVAVGHAVNQGATRAADPAARVAGAR